MPKSARLALCALFLAACAGREPAPPPPPVSMNAIAEAYVKLVLALGELDSSYVDAYYGPPQWREQAHRQTRALSEIHEQAEALMIQLSSAALEPDVDPRLQELRRGYLRNQLGALNARAGLLQGLKLSFDDEARALYDINPPHYQETDFAPALRVLDQLLPQGSGTLSQRYNAFLERYAVPPARLDAVMRAAIEAARAATLAHLPLPPGERFELAYVSGKPWSAYNWYQGEFTSHIELNTGLPISVSRVVELAVHEGYPGHHVYNVLLEQHLYRERGWVEWCVYPLYSPQSLIAEGSADYGIELAFPPAQRLRLVQQLFQVAGFDPAQAAAYDEVVRAGRRLGPAAIEAARRYLDGQLTAGQTAQWLQDYALASPARAQQRVAFFDSLRSYIVNYSYGEELVRGYIERLAGPAADARWAAYAQLLSTPRTPLDLAPAAP
jgi:hypothetical protein